MKKLTALTFFLLGSSTSVYASHLDERTGTEPILKKTKASAPRAVKRPTQQTYHGITIHDDFAWLRDPQWKSSEDGVKDPEILDHIKAEETYTEEYLASVKGAIDQYVKRRKAMIPELIDSYPTKEHGFNYLVRQGTKYQHPVYLRYPEGSTIDQAVAYFDSNKEAEGHDFFNADGLEVSPSGQYLVYAVDHEGHENYQLRIRDLNTGQELPETMERVLPGFVWSPDSKDLYYFVRDEFDRPTYAFKHTLGTPTTEDKLIYQEEDPSSHMCVVNTNDHKYLLVLSSTSDEDEVWGLDLSRVDAPLTQLVQKKAGRRIELEHRNGMFYILTNDTGTNFRIARAPASRIMDESSWEEVIPCATDVFITHILSCARGIGVSAQKGGLGQIGLLDESNKRVQYLTMPDQAYKASLEIVPYDAEFLRFSYSSLSTPESVLEADFNNLQVFIRKTREIPCGHNPQDYEVNRWFVTARDGAQVPVSLVYKRDRFQRNGQMPVVLYGYGAYGHIIDPEFNTGFIPYLDHGFAYAIAHVRGGAEMGYQWYLDGKMGKKQNTFNDFIDVAKDLVAKGYTAEGNISAMGGSAGGILMGAIANQAPQLFKSVVAIVPCMDLLNTMLDSTQALVPPEYTEWGNPEASKEQFQWIQSYAPYENMHKGPYPAIYATGGIYDSRVAYWEPLKYVAKMRHLSPETPIWLRMKVAGHFGGMSLDDQLAEKGEFYAFIMNMHGIKP